MADIVVRCGKCGRDNKVSEYATSGAVLCASCRTPIDLPSQTATSRGKLQMRMLQGTRGDRLTTETSEGSATTAPTTISPSSAVMGDVHKIRQKVRAPLALWGWLIFLAAAGLLVGAEYFVTVINPDFLSYYLMGRYVIWGFITLLVLITAFEDGLGQGFFCLLVPLYIVYYAFIRVEYYWLRGIFLAAVVSIAAEVYYLPDAAAVILAQRGLNRGIELVGTQITRAGESDAPPPVLIRRGGRRVVPTDPRRR